MIWSCFRVVVYPVGVLRASSSWTSLTVLGPRRQSTRRIASSASVGRGSSAMERRYTKVVVFVNEDFRRSPHPVQSPSHVEARRPRHPSFSCRARDRPHSRRPGAERAGAVPGERTDPELRRRHGRPGAAGHRAGRPGAAGARGGARGRRVLRGRPVRARRRPRGGSRRSLAAAGGDLARRAAGARPGGRLRGLRQPPGRPQACSASARPAGWARSSAGASSSSPTSSTPPSAPATAIPCAGCSPTRSASARRSRPA